MKSSNKPTTHILLKANTNSEWNGCDYAVITLSKNWKKEQAKRLEAVAPFAGDYSFQSLSYFDTAVDFYSTGKVNQPGVEQLLTGKDWAFVQLEEGEQDTFTQPENGLEYYSLVIHRGGTASYKAYGKHTGEEFWTEQFSLNTICALPLKETRPKKMCKEQFSHLSNQQLVDRINRLPDFQCDDEAVELGRRRRLSNGAFDYEKRLNTIIIIKDNLWK